MLHRGLPQPSGRNVSVRLDARASARVRQGHPWVFADGVTRTSHEGGPGDVAVLYDQRNKFLGAGLFDPNSPIRVRVLHATRGEPPGAPLFRERIAAALAPRAPLIEASDTTGYRVLYGPNDRMPGVVVDRYGDHLVLKLYSEAWLPWLGPLVEELGRLPDVEHLVLRLARGPSAHYGRYDLTDGAYLFGTPQPQPIVFLENGLRFEADVVSGQKTGFFLDQRDNRSRVEALSNGRTVLNVFAYNGGFSLYAARGGARRVVSVDISAPACRAADRNFALNAADPNVAACTHETIAADAFETMRARRDIGERFDIVIVDPPSFAKRASEVDGALRAYGRLARLAAELRAPNGTLVLASCSSRVSAEVFETTVLGAARAVTPGLTVTERTGHPIDHPIAFDESAYLKCVFAR